MDRERIIKKKKGFKEGCLWEQQKIVETVERYDRPWSEGTQHMEERLLDRKTIRLHIIST